jgi:hypothetical protein
MFSIYCSEMSPDGSARFCAMRRSVSRTGVPPFGESVMLRRPGFSGVGSAFCSSQLDRGRVGDQHHRALEAEEAEADLKAKNRTRPRQNNYRGAASRSLILNRLAQRSSR